MRLAVVLAVVVGLALLLRRRQPVSDLPHRWTFQGSDGRLYEATFDLTSWRDLERVDSV